MASIAKLAVILSAVSKPLEDDLKKANGKVAAFSHGIGHLGKLFTGLFLFDSVEKGFKKAIKGNEELNQAAEKCEAAFGSILLNLTGMASWLPKLTALMEYWADLVSNLAEEIQILKEQFESIKMKVMFSSDEEIRNRVEAMRAEYNQAIVNDNFAKRRAKAERDHFEEAREAQWLQIAGTEQQKELLKELEGQYKSLAMADPAYKKAMDAAILKDAPDSSAAGSIKHLTEEIAKLKEKNKLRAEEWTLVQEAEALRESLLTPEAKRAREMEKVNNLLEKGLINMEEWWAAAEKLADQLEDAKEIQDEFNNDVPERDEPRFASAVEAGSAEAYSAIIKAQAGTRDNTLVDVGRKHVGISQEALQVNKKMLEAQGSAVEALKASRINVITFGGV